MEVVQVSLTTLFAIVAGVVFACVYCIMYDKETRESVVALSISLLVKHALSNAKLLELIESVRRWMNGDQGPTHSPAHLVTSGKVMLIPFVYEGNNYKLLVPYDRRDARRGGRMFSIVDEAKVDLYHCPGIPFTVTAEQLGCSSIVRDDDEGF